ncbi:RNA-binding protein S1 [Salipaludibacillus agaradhaerens]|uniref:S1 domain-containing RNA-binding protein n=1 Tax=Salipaludibacillus agaradhaerens TaxID=76935 RepID=UPI002150A21E|nr:S1 domain-containing RNA-binding protein [Salipaludibacillus agaradhaerens]MCR6104765.1 RNA-binding protein S1 [Salipaludibacillus agaradhaerens]MCR6116813.1 RNA-binding protein S1 [Salipaludibacillus agaradhaerens]
MSIEVGSKCQGKVTGITNFGAFVELPSGSTGLVHISEVADSYVKDINEFLTVGDEVTVKVMNVEKDGKIGLSIRKAKAPEEGAKKAERTARQPVKPRRKEQPSLSFEDKMNRFLKDSEERLSSLKRNTESKRGGRNTKRG